MIETSLSLFHDKRISNCTSIYCITQISMNALTVIWKNVVTMRCVATLQALIVVYVTVYLVFTDDDECANQGGGNNCHADAFCTNTVGSFTCECNTGYSGNGVTCEGKTTNHRQCLCITSAL